jgi:short-subunit dehydrogenase
VLVGHLESVRQTVREHCAAKFVLQGFSEALAYELALQNVRLDRRRPGTELLPSQLVGAGCKSADRPP